MSQFSQNISLQVADSPIVGNALEQASRVPDITTPRILRSVTRPQPSYEKPLKKITHLSYHTLSTHLKIEVGSGVESPFLFYTDSKDIVSILPK